MEGALALSLSLSLSLSPEATRGSQREATEARLLFPLRASWVGQVECVLSMRHEVDGEKGEAGDMGGWIWMVLLKRILAGAVAAFYQGES